MLIDSAKVVINIASVARVTMLSTKHLVDLPASSALLGKAEDVARDMLKVVPIPQVVAFPDDAIEATIISARDNADGGLRAGPATGSQMEQYSGDVNGTVELSAHTLFAARLDGTKRSRHGQMGMMDPRL